MTEQTETGWLCERSHEGSPQWLCVLSGCFNWTPDRLKAIRFARREDAEQIAEIVEDVYRITEHQWG